MGDVVQIRPDVVRVWPHSLVAEASVIGGILLQPHVLERLDALETDDFYHLPHRVVFDAIRNVVARGEPIDVVTVEMEIDRRGKLDAIGGVAFLGELALRVPTADNVVVYAGEVRRHAANRRGIDALSRALERAYNWPHDPAELLAEVGGELQRLDARAGGPSANDIELRILADYAADIVAQSTVPALASGIRALDRLAPVALRSMATLVGPTGAGKTSLAMTIGAHRTRYTGTPAAEQGPTIYFLYELTPVQFAARRTAQLSRFTQRQVLGGAMELHEIESTLTGETFYVMKPPRGSIFRDYARRVLDAVAKISPGIPLLVADYLQRMSYAGDIREGVARNVDDFVDLVESRDMYGLLLSKGSRSGSREMRGGKAKGEELIDVSAETSAIEAGSSAVYVITYENRDGNDTTDMTIEIAKSRFGSTGGSFGMRFHGPSGRWEELDEVPVPRAVASMERDLLDAVSREPGKHKTRSEVVKAANLQKSAGLAAMRRLLVPGGAIEERSDGFYPRGFRYGG